MYLETWTSGCDNEHSGQGQCNADIAIDCRVMGRAGRLTLLSDQGRVESHQGQSGLKLDSILALSYNARSLSIESAGIDILLY